MTRRVFAGALSSLLVPGTSLWAFEPPQTVISVQVKNDYGKPVQHGSVILDFLSGHDAKKLGARRKIHWEMRLNLEGGAKFPSIPQGKVRVQVIADGYQTFGQNFDVDESAKTIDIKLNYPQKQYSVHGDMPPTKPEDKPKETTPPPQ
ncbi:MAG: hypothetical protein WBW33_21080 [Bryobacteraceae bacterium]